MTNNTYKLSLLLISPVKFIGYIWGLLCLHKVLSIFNLIGSEFYLGYYKRRFKYFGENSKILKMQAFLNLRYVSIGSNTVIEKGALLRCYPSSDNKIGEIIIGNNVNIGLNVNISSCNKIEIKDGVLTGRNVLINDNSHGYTKSKQDIEGNPINRPIVSKGCILIDKNVWIGENSVILAGVKIGRNSIIGANSVVTKSIPPYSIAGGIPAKIITQYEK